MQLVKAIINEVEQNIIITRLNPINVQYVDDKGTVFTANVKDVRVIEIIKELNPLEEMTVSSLIRVTVELQNMKKIVGSIIERNATIKSTLALKDIAPLLSDKGYKNLFYLQKEGTVTLAKNPVPETLCVHDFSNYTVYEFSQSDKAKVAEALNFNYPVLNNTTFVIKIKDIFNIEKEDNNSQSAENQQEDPTENLINHGYAIFQNLASAIEKIINPDEQ